MFGHFLVGLEGAGQFGDVSGSKVPPFGAQDDRDRTEVQAIVLGSARMGIAMNRLLAYAKGGYAGADVKASLSDTTGGSQGTWSDEEWLHGWSIGGGLEAMLTPHIVVGADYQYIDLGSKNFSATVSDGGNYANDIDVQLQEVKARLSFKF